MRVRLATTVVALIAFVFTAFAAPIQADAADAAVPARKVVVIVGPTAISQSTYVPMADNVAATATAAGATVTKLYCKDATPTKVLAATAGANVIVYFGHGNGFPNPYTSPPYTYDAGQVYPNGTNGWGLAKDGGTKCDDSNLQYYGENWITANVKPAPGFTMIYSNACYTPGAGEDEAGHPTDERMAWTRVGYYSRGVLGMGAGAYFASDLWHGSSSLVDLILKNPTMSYGEIFKRASGYVAGAERPYVHPMLGNRQVWLHRSGNFQGLQSWWYAFAGNPNNTPTNANAAVPAAPPAPSLLPVDRIAGADRYATAALTSQSTFGESVPLVYVATGTNFPDALAAGAAAAKQNVPVLLVQPNSIPSATIVELQRLKPARIAVVGSASVVSEGVREALRGYTTAGEAFRIAGPDRYATAAAVSANAFTTTPVAVVSIATGANFPDALAGVSPTAMAGGPILLVSPRGIPDATKAELARLQPQKILIFGSAGVVSSQIASELDGYTSGDVVRLAGANRYDTAVAISAANFTYADVVYVATGLNFPDALAAGPVAGVTAGPLLLVPGTSVPASVQAELSRLGPERVVVLGSAPVVSQNVIDQIRAAVGN